MYELQGKYFCSTFKKLKIKQPIQKIYLLSRFTFSISIKFLLPQGEIARLKKNKY